MITKVISTQCKIDYNSISVFCYKYPINNKGSGIISTKCNAAMQYGLLKRNIFTKTGD